MKEERRTKGTRNPDGKRLAVHDAAMFLFAESGFESVSVADIARRARVAVGTVYRLYPNKIALLRALHSTMEAKFVTCIARAWDSELQFEVRVRNLVTQLLRLIEEERDQLVILSMTTDVSYENGLLPGDLVRAKIAEVISKDIASGEPVFADPAIVAPILHGAVEGAMRHILRRPPIHNPMVEATLSTAISAVLRS